MSPHLPVIFLTARDSDADRISSQRMTAWDYITKPVSLEFLVARVHALLRIAEQLQQPVDSEASIKVDHLEIDERSMSVVWRNEIVNLTLTEFWLVESLARRPGHVKTYEALNDVTPQGLVSETSSGLLIPLLIEYKLFMAPAINGPTTRCRDHDTDNRQVLHPSTTWKG